jgi:5-methyltetrahydrofolate--homocysteine methyltransferase
MLLLDGAMGTMLQQGHSPRDVHAAYVRAGANVVLTNTFHDSTAENIARAVADARAAADGRQGVYVALDIAPTGRLLAPMGDMAFDEAYEIFRAQVLAGKAAGADAIYIETQTCLLEAKCAVLAAKENSSLPIICTMSFDENMRTFTGTTAAAAAITLCGLGVDFIGANCSVGPAAMRGITAELLKWSSAPVIIKPNAGMPSYENGETVYNVSPADFAAEMHEIAGLGVAGIGGCCGTTPDFIAAIVSAIEDIARGNAPRSAPALLPAVLCSARRVVEVDRVRVVGERINPTGKRELRRALKDRDFAYLIAFAAQQSRADILDINVSMPKTDEPSLLRDTILHIQNASDAPLSIDSTCPTAIEAALRVTSGKPIINSVNGDDESLQAILPLAKKYGAAIVGLTLDRHGIPATAEARAEIADKIIRTAVSHGIPKCDIFIDCLTMTAASGKAPETLRALPLVKNMGVKTMLGVSNISFGLEKRGGMNHAFLCMALAAGLDMPIIDPCDAALLDAIAAFHMLHGLENEVEEVERAATSQELPPRGNGEKIILATVKGDIHDIGKNLVKNALNAHGYNVIDLGKDVPAQEIVAATTRHGARLVGLSALMTTTIHSMEGTIAAIKQENAATVVMVGGAVLTQSVADAIGADYYGKTAASAATIAEKVFS